MAEDLVAGRDGEAGEGDCVESLEWLTSLPESRCRSLLHARILYLSDVDASIKVLEEMEPAPDVYLALAASHIGSSSEEEFLDKAIKLDWNTPAAWHRKAEIAREQGHVSRAMDFLKRALEVSDDFSGARYDLA